jgi:hypothetical protein
VERSSDDRGPGDVRDDHSDRDGRTLGADVTTDRDTIEDAHEDAPDTEGVSVQDAESLPGRTASFGKLSPSQAARLRWDREKARQQDADEQAAHEAKGITVIVRTSVPIGKIIAKLSQAAQKGDVAAARELRAYLAEAAIETETDLSALDRRTLQTLKARLLQELADEDGLAAFETTETIPDRDEEIEPA